MLKDITLGQYFPGDTVIHRLDPRTKILLTSIYMICVFTAKNYISYLIPILFLGMGVVLSKISPRTLLRGMRPLLLIIAFTTLVNMFYTDGTVIWSFGFLKVTREGIQNAVFMMLRVMLLVMGTFLLTYTTSPIALTDGLEQLLSFLKRFRVPIHELSMIMSIALRFIPTLIDEADKIMNAQKARGANFDTGGLIERAKALLPLLIPLFLSAFRRADELAIAMESRCYHGGEGRTRMKELSYTGIDLAAFFISAVLLASVILLAVNGL